MNLVGKIFTVLIFIMALVFMGFAVSIYAVHKNWKEEATELASQKGELEEKNQQLKDEKAKLESEVEAERKAKDQVIAKLETEYTLLKDEHTQLEQMLGQIDKERRTAVAALNATNSRLAELDAEVVKQHIDIAQAQKDREAAKYETDGCRDGESHGVRR